MAPRKRCLLCGSRQWRKNAVGLVTCSEGHVLQHYINEVDDVDGVDTHTIKKRTLKSNRKKKQRASRADPKLYHGDRARFHYYQCLQLLFRKQVAALVALWNLPPEFETICRDLWAFHLNLIPNPPPAEPFHYAREQEGYQREETTMSPSRPEKDGVAHSPESAVPESDEISSSSQDELLAPEIAVLLEENSEIGSSDHGSSSDEPTTSTQPRARNGMHTSPQNPFVSRADRPENTIALLALACWTLRLPVIYIDFINAIESHSLPYLDHVHFFPSTLTRHLTKHAVQALSPHHAPKTLSLHRLTARLANRLYDMFDVAIPELNAPPILWRVVRECFCGTPVLYALTKRVGSVLSLGLSLQGSTPGVLLTTGRGADSERYEDAPPEISLVAAAIVALKLVYGLDGKERQASLRASDPASKLDSCSRLPRNSDDAACALPAVTEFLATLKEVDHAECRVNSRQFGSRVILPVGDLDDTSLDEYLDFCQKVLLHPKKDEHRVIENYFPLLTETASLTRGEQLGQRGRGLSSTRKNGVDDGILEPGEMYTIYDAKDVLGDLSGDLKIVIERSARWAGIDCDFMCGVVERYERRLMRWWNVRQQGDREGD